MGYRVREIFYSLQGEGAYTGRPAVFCRFSGCNLWSGQHKDRTSAVCRFCDTNFLGIDGPHGGDYQTPRELVQAIVQTWPGGAPSAIPIFVVCTGGEPLLQMDEPLIEAMHAARCYVAVETNGTLPSPIGIDWLTVSPKPKALWQQCSGDELKLVFPQECWKPHELEHLTFKHFFLQPMDDDDRKRNTQLAVRYCLEHPRWRLSLQVHKLLGVK